MDKDTIKKLNRWFRKMERESYGTYHHTKKKDGEDLYVVRSLDVDDFTDWLKENTFDLCYIPCKVDTDGIFFTSEDLKNAEFY